MFHRWLCTWSNARVVGVFGPQVTSIKVSLFFRLMARECSPSLSRGEGPNILTTDQTLLFGDLNSSPLFHSKWSRISQVPTVIADSCVLVLSFLLPYLWNVLQSALAYTPLSSLIQVLTFKVWRHHRNSQLPKANHYRLWPSCPLQSFQRDLLVPVWLMTVPGRLTGSGYVSSLVFTPISWVRVQALSPWNC